MGGHDESRRGFLAGGAVGAASTAFAATASGQSAMVINDPKVVREIEAQFAAYDEALAKNDVAALGNFFFESPTTVRYGNAENLYGHAEIQAYRSGVGTGARPKRERTVIITYGNDFATMATLSRTARAGRIGRTMQTWVRFPQGWRIVAAHVSTIDEPGKP
jgi:ketosteroid isomerase-like protein